MKDLKKISSQQLYSYWKNLSIGLLSIVALIAFSILLPYYFSPIVALVTAATLYTILFNNRHSQESACMLVLYSIFFGLICYSFVTILINIAYVWGFLHLPAELTFFNYPYLPVLWLDPICFITIAIIYLRRRRLKICLDCKLEHENMGSRSNLGSLLSRESHLLLRNLMILFALLSVVCWIYYLEFYVATNISARDRYIFMWLNIIAFILDEIYFMFRYYNLYLDLKESDEIISHEDIQDMPAMTYLRYYVVCGEEIYLNTKSVDPDAPYRTQIDTPFLTERDVMRISLFDVKSIIAKMTGIKDGEVKFFYGRKMRDMDQASVLRYFYFLDGKPEHYPELGEQGEWISFEELKKIYSFNPGALSDMCVTDITRLATIVLTQKTFDEKGFRRNKLKTYRPTFTLAEIRNSGIDFQDDKWMRISVFNSDIPLYRFKKWWKKFTGDNGAKKINEW